MRKWCQLLKINFLFVISKDSNKRKIFENKNEKQTLKSIFEIEKWRNLTSKIFSHELAFSLHRHIVPETLFSLNNASECLVITDSSW